MSGIWWYLATGVRRRMAETWPVYCSIAAGGGLVFVVVALNAMVRQQAQSQLLATVDGGKYLEFAAACLMVLGVLVSLLHTQLLMQRLVEDRYLEFGVLINIGVARVTVALLIIYEQLGHAAVGGLIGIAFGCLLSLLTSFSRDFISPAPSDVAAASGAALAVPLLAVIPVALTLLFRLLRSPGGVARVR